MSDLKKQLAELVAKREAAEAAEAAAAEQRELELDLAGEVAIAEAVAAHGALGSKVAALRTSAGTIVVKRPHHIEMRKFQAIEKATEAEAIAFIKTCLVYPSAAQLETILEEYPAVGGPLMTLVVRLALGRVEEVVGKR